MSKPAARQTDSTAHGGVIVVGFPTVMIGGMPAARVGDFHACPMLNPGLPPPPHVGGPIAMGSPTVLVGNMPAARAGDMATCAGPPDTIAMGCPTVMIGESGSGSASGGGPPGVSAVAGAQASAVVAGSDANESILLQEHWVEIAFVDAAGLPVSGVAYTFTDPDDAPSSGVLRLDGTVRRDGLSEGTCTVVLHAVSRAEWSKDKAKVGDAVKLSARVEGFESGTEALFQVFKRDMEGPDAVVDEVRASTQGEKVEAEWTFAYPHDLEAMPAEDVEAYAAPTFYFEVIVGRSRARSGILVFDDVLELTLRDDQGRRLANEDYILTFSNGAVRTGRLDDRGHLKEEQVPPAHWRIAFPNLAGFFRE